MGLSKLSSKRLSSCDQKIINIVTALVEDGHDILVIEGARTLDRQEELMASGKSSLKDASIGKHVISKENPLSRAIDIAPLPLDWNDTKRFYAFGELVVAKAKELNTPIRWGGDWDGDGDYTDQTFNDLVHFELA